MITPLTREQIEGLLPHKGAMCLLDAALECTADAIHCAADAARLDHPLRAADGLAVVHGIEYGAQAAALHQMLTRQQRQGATGGLLLQMRNVQFAVDYLDRLPQPLRVAARCAMASSELARYQFEVHGAEQLAARGELTLSLTR